MVYMMQVRILSTMVKNTLWRLKDSLEVQRVGAFPIPIATEEVFGIP